MATYYTVVLGLLVLSLVPRSGLGTRLLSATFELLFFYCLLVLPM